MTCALVTVYHPSECVQFNLSRIAKQVDMLYICDNSPSPNDALSASMDGAAGIRYTWFGENLGLSCAFNRILKDPEIPWQDDDFLFFFDQDSCIEEQHIGRMLAVYRELLEAGFQVGCLGPVYFNTSRGEIEIPKSKQTLLRGTYAVSSVITSSMLCTYGNLRAIGFWNEDVFLDMADWELCWRLCAAGKLCCMTETVVLRHSVGSGEKKIGPLHLRVGEPIREYYQIRECLYLFGKKYTPMKFRIRFLAMLLIRTPLHLIFLNHRKDRMKYIALGLADFFRHRKGELHDGRAA